MSCGGSMMRSGMQPLARLVDAAAEKWLAVEHASAAERLAVQTEITESFRIGDRPELTFHGRRYLLMISRDSADNQLLVNVHEIEVG